MEAIDHDAHMQKKVQTKSRKVLLVLLEWFSRDITETEKKLSKLRKKRAEIQRHIQLIDEGKERLVKLRKKSD